MIDESEPPTVYGRIFIPGPLPGINDFLRERSKMGPVFGGTKRVNNYGRMKKQLEGTVRLLCAQAGIRSLPPCCYTFVHYELSRQRNPDNIAGGAHKVFFDALVRKPAPIIPNDGWAEILDFKDWWVLAPARPGVMVWAADRILEKTEAIGYAPARGAGAVTGYAARPRARRTVAGQ